MTLKEIQIQFSFVSHGLSRNFSSADEELIDFGSVFVYWRYGGVTGMTVGGKDDMHGSSKNHPHLSHQMKMVRNAGREGHVQTLRGWRLEARTRAGNCCRFNHLPQPCSKPRGCAAPKAQGLGGSSFKAPQSFLASRLHGSRLDGFKASALQGFGRLAGALAQRSSDGEATPTFTQLAR